MTDERLREIEENAKWIRMDAANNGDEREYALAVDACELVAEVKALRAKLDAVPVRAITTVTHAAVHAYDMSGGRADVQAITTWLRERIKQQDTEPDADAAAGIVIPDDGGDE